MKLELVPPDVVEALRERGVSSASVANMTPDEVFHEYCEWHGLIGWSGRLWQAVTDLSREHRDDG